MIAAARAGLDRGIRQSVVRQLEQMMSADVDPVGMRSITVLSSVICTLVEVSPESAKIGELAGLLVQGAIEQSSSGEGRRVAWGQTTARDSAASVPHTARAVWALVKMHDAGITVGAPADKVLDAGLDWLSHVDDLELVNEMLRREIVQPGGGEAMDMLYISHFTPAWVARALMGRRVDEHITQLRRCVQAVLAHQEKGVWKWKDPQGKPIWMTYQGVMVLRDYSLLNLPWPP
jgi:hypothetical protein